MYLTKSPITLELPHEVEESAHALSQCPIALVRLRADKLVDKELAGLRIDAFKGRIHLDLPEAKSCQ